MALMKEVLMEDVLIKEVLMEEEEEEVLIKEILRQVLMERLRAAQPQRAKTAIPWAKIEAVIRMAHGKCCSGPLRSRHECKETGPLSCPRSPGWRV
jgi:hypothetical protein